MDEIGYPADPERKQAFAKVFAHLGNDAAAGYHRGMICVYAGQPRAALYYFMDAFRRCGVGKFQDYAIALVVNGLRPVRGHRSDSATLRAIHPLRSKRQRRCGKPPRKTLSRPTRRWPRRRPLSVPPPAEQDVQLLKEAAWRTDGLRRRRHLAAGRPLENLLRPRAAQ